LRYFNVYGPRQRADSPYSGVLARWGAAISAGEPCIIFGNGEQTRDFVSVHDVAAANVALVATTEAQWGEVHNVATGASVSLNEILTELEAILGREPHRRYEPPRAGDLLHSEGNSNRLRDLGWAPHVTLHEGLTELLSSGEQDPSLAEDLVARR
jgi:UDP-glucose 4-epimerase